MGEVVSDTSGEMIQKLSGIRSVPAALLFSVTASRSCNRHFTDVAAEVGVRGFPHRAERAN